MPPLGEFEDGAPQGPKRGSGGGSPQGGTELIPTACSWAGVMRDPAQPPAGIPPVRMSVPAAILAARDDHGGGQQ
ncbi:hypothetical protein EJ357_16075 [Streptomyces cyaneochromogenes]|uniref:Uncharacterized protein n=1 Tax=Streptomyces cyaneochromogenes TaxID=2496836 RepID=A0A3Q9ERW7_9ACTN|nr:hypothetical protein EJ357_16075 [Streptomyces cyaneochromogenes]